MTTDFFDQKTEKGWNEVLITSETDPAAPKIITPSASSVQSSLPTKAKFRLRTAPEPTAKSVLLGQSSPRFDTLPIGSRVEASPVSFRLARKVAELLSIKDNEKGVGGSALIIDYGDERAFSNSFRVCSTF
jgi:NADH dehydrogenase [ubiquinone] 1 alpha subcomplex assembly factor 7